MKHPWMWFAIGYLAGVVSCYVFLFGRMMLHYLKHGAGG